MEELQRTALVAGKWLMEVDMFPTFFFGHFLIACIIVREDSKDLGPRWRQQHPFASWLCTLITGLAGLYVANFLFGDPLVDGVKDTPLVVFMTLLWYLMNYSPWDVAYKVALSPPVVIAASLAQEVLRTRFMYLGLQAAVKLYPEAPLVALIGGAVKGNGYGFIKLVERCIRGKWEPKENDILQTTYFGKSAVYGSLTFLLHERGVIKAPIEIVTLGVVGVFVVFRLAILIFKVKDPLLPLETPVTRLLFGSSSETPTAEPTKQKEEKAKPVKEKGSGDAPAKKEKVKSKADKKRD